MNLLRQREKLKELHREGILETDHLHSALNCPVFVWSPEHRRDLTQSESDYINQKICGSNTHVPTRAPFQSFRIAMKRCFDQWFFYENEMRWIVLRVAYSDPKTGPEQWYMNIYGCNAGDRCEYQVWRDGKCVTEWIMNPDNTPKEAAVEIMRSIPRTLAYFIFDSTHPKSVVIKQSPECKGKSIEWRIAREHYLILDRNAARACRDSKSSPNDSQITRGAHWRIAHPRVLRSPKFKHKQGQEIWIKHCWVGPDEWQGLDGKTYKVISLYEK